MIFNRDANLPADADANGNGLVDNTDLNLIVNNYNAKAAQFGSLSFGANAVTYSAIADLNNDSIINVRDMAQVGFQWSRI